MRAKGEDATASSPGDAPAAELSAYAFSILREGPLTLTRGRGKGLTPIILAAPAGEYPSPGLLQRLEHEHALREELEAGWAARPMALVTRNGRPTLVLKDPGGEPLDRLLGRPMDVLQFLRTAVPLAAAIARMHARGLIHKDIKPANILVDRASGGVWLTGFGIASLLPRERQVPAPPEVIAGTLAYMAPEQTGRMNRSVDSRSDLYALGVTFYEMLTGDAALRGRRSDGVDPLPHRPAAGAAQRAGRRHPGAARGDRPEAAGQDGGGPLPDRGRAREPICGDAWRNGKRPAGSSRSRSGRGTPRIEC